MKKQATNERRQKLIDLLATLTETVNALDEAWGNETDSRTLDEIMPTRASLETLFSPFGAAGRGNRCGSYLALHVEEWKDNSTAELQKLMAGTVDGTGRK